MRFILTVENAGENLFEAIKALLKMQKNLRFELQKTEEFVPYECTPTYQRMQKMSPARREQLSQEVEEEM